MPTLLRAIISWAIALWSCFIFLGSLPYKFTAHPDTQHIFGTIGEWLAGLLGSSIGDAFSSFGAYVVGSVELITSIILLLPALLWVVRKVRGSSGNAQTTGNTRARFHAIGGLLAATVMSGAVFFHLFTPLGIEVLHQGQSDGGSLFYSAVSILVGGIVLYLLNRFAFTKTES